jgi:hypothetical protein
VNATWTVKPGGTISFSGSAQVRDATNSHHVKAVCTSVKMGGTLKNGSGLSGTALGTIKTASFKSCTLAGVSVTVTTHGLPWKLNATSFKSGVTTGTISGIDLVATGPGCTATLDGTGAGKDNGKAAITYTNSTGKLALLGTGGNLHSWGIAPNTCFGVINNGDVQQASGGGAVTPKQTITSP